jgi:glycosyltransferase involved in cell wall biosynthesis
MADKPTVSIIVPVYNQEKYLSQCIDSILKQSYTDFVCILVDDGSTDKSPEMCDEFGRRDNRIRVIHKENGGLTSARKAGFDICDSEYVCFLDSDDYLHEDFLKKNLEAIISNDADVCTSGHFQDADGTIISDTFDYPVPLITQENMISEYVLPIVGKIYSDGYLNYPGYVWGRIYKTDCIEEECFVSEREVYTEDDMFQMYLGKNLKRAVFISDKLLYYRVNAASLTHAYRKNMWGMLKERHRRVLEFFRDMDIPHVKERLIASGFYAVYVTLRNAYELNSYKNFKAEIKQMLQDDLSKDILDSLIDKLLKPRQKLMVFFLKRKMYFALYHSKKLLFR